MSATGTLVARDRARSAAWARNPHREYRNRAHATCTGRGGTGVSARTIRVHRLALLEERGDAFLCVVRDGGTRHHVDRILVRGGLAELGLGVEAALADGLRC